MFQFCNPLPSVLSQFSLFFSEIMFCYATLSRSMSELKLGNLSHYLTFLRFRKSLFDIMDQRPQRDTRIRNFSHYHSGYYPHLRELNWPFLEIFLQQTMVLLFCNYQASNRNLKLWKK